MVTLAHLRTKGSQGKDVLVLNTHFDVKSTASRVESSKLILDRVGQLGKGKKKSKPLIIVMGDLNANEDEEPFQMLTGYRYAQSSAEKSSSQDQQQYTSLIDTRRGADGKTPPDRATYTGFGEKMDHPNLIDFILVADNDVVGSQWRITEYSIANNVVRLKGYKARLSDHKMVTATFQLQD